MQARVSDIDLTTLLHVAVDAALDAGSLLVARFRTDVEGIGSKSSSTDMVSDADREAEASIRERLRAARPDDAILGEERGDEPGSSGLRWIVDPLDGTTNFLFGIPQWCVSVACEDERGGIVGVVHDPVRGETFTATRRGGAFRNGVPIHVSVKTDLGDSLIATGFSYLPVERAAAAEILIRVLPRVRDVRRAGAAALDLAWTAAGLFDGYYEAPTHRWDWAAGAVLVREAGGTVSEMPAIGPSGPGLIAAGPALHDALRSLVLG
jgi:myo-inositol-1(or 4)-monophosphatase